MHPIRVEQTAWLLLLGKRNLGHGCWSLGSCISRNSLAVSTWILNGSSVECHEKKHQPFSLSCVRFGSRAIQISGWKSANFRLWSHCRHFLKEWLSFVAISLGHCHYFLAHVACRNLPWQGLWKSSSEPSIHFSSWVARSHFDSSSSKTDQMIV